MADNCVFCAIVKKEIPAKIVGESPEWMSFHDIHPQAPVHIVLIPKKHLNSISDFNRKNGSLASEMIFELGRIAEKAHLGQSGYRIVVNSNADGGQTVPHLHFHLLGGRSMKWPPG